MLSSLKNTCPRVFVDSEPEGSKEESVVYVSAYMGAYM